jgi:hypothetical protein
MILGQLERTLMEDCSLYIYTIDIQTFINKFQLKKYFLILLLNNDFMIGNYVLQMYSKGLLHHYYLHQFHNIMID